MIGLNKIGLNQVQLNRLRLNAPFPAYGKMAGGGGSGDGFPQLPGDVTRWHFGGLTNEMMAAMDDPRIEDVDHKGRFLSFKNFAWKGMSGVNGYKFDFLLNEWVINNNQVSEKYSYKIVINNKQNSVQLYNRINLGHIKITLKITGIEINKSTFRVYDNVGTKHAQDYTKDGICEIDYTANEGANIIYFYVFGGNMGQLENPITIEQLPLYPGALVFDGVDDYGVCENFPILTKEKGYTVVALRQWITYNPNAISAIATNASDQSFNGAFTFENYNKGAEQTISYGATQITLQYSKSPFSWQTTSKYNGVNIANGNKDATNSLVLGRSYPQRNEFANFAIWELVFLDHDATEEELTKIKDYFVKTYPWLFPDQAWTVVGKTNEDEDRATIANITGNGNDLVLSNFGFAEGSGYNEEGEYAGYLVTDGVDDKITSSAFEMGKDFTIVGYWKFIDNKKSGTGLVKGSSFYIYNTMIGLDLYINSGSVKNSLDGIKSINAACSDGRAYDPNWDEILANTGNVVGSGGILEVSSSGGRFDRIAFKNLAIYLRILSKDDCIKAYNYLQTLKAK